MVLPHALFLAGLAAGLALPIAAAANDSSAALEAGGLRLTRDERVRMVEEDLFVSRAEVRVAYVFENTAEAPARMLVAFPLPKLDLSELAEVPVDAPAPDPVNFVGFEVTVDGKPLKPAIEMRASRNGVDVTETLIRYGVPLSRFDSRLYPTLLGLNPAVRTELTTLNLAEWDDLGNVYPLWTTRTTFYWPQTFPAKGRVRIEHRYKPVVGQSFFGLNSFDAATRAQYCMDETFVAAARQRLEARNGAMLVGYRIRYVLTTGANWAGPIGQFRLTLDKGSPQALLSVCADGLKKTGPTQFVLERRDFVPTRDLDVLILEGGAK